MAKHRPKSSSKYLGFSRSKVNHLNNWVSLNIEPGGARVKSIISPPGENSKFLYKVPKYGDFERVTEIFNSLLAQELQISHVQYMPGKFGSFPEGVFCKSFLNEAKIEELWEMKELICRHSKVADLSKRKGRANDVLREHNIEFIYMILEVEFGTSVLPRLFEMIGFDALIGHGDRHWSNYGVIVSGWPTLMARFSPIYDTASGYLVEYEESIVKEMLKNELLETEWYAPSNTKGLCKITVPGNIKSNHFDLMIFILENPTMRKYKSSLQKAFSLFNPRVTKFILNQFFPYLSPIRRACIEKILSSRWQIGNEIFMRYNP